MPTADPDTDELLAAAEAGDAASRGQLLDRHRGRLRRMVALRLDARLAARLDPSDVVQDALTAAAEKLDDYLARRPVPFYLWVRQITWEQLVKTHQRHTASKRAVAREEPPPLTDESVRRLADRLAPSADSPSRRAVRAELHARVRAAAGPIVGGRPRGAGPAAPGAALDGGGGGRARVLGGGGEGSTRAGATAAARPARRFGRHPMTRESPPTIAPAVGASLAELVERLTAQVQTGQHVDEVAVLAEHPEHASELRRLLPAIAVLAELSRSGADRGVVPVDVPGGGVLGDFRIVREVGRGGMGVVYEAEQISLHRRVALKVLPFAAVADPRHLQRFKNEALAAASLDHPHVVKVYGVGCERGIHFIALQYVEGRSLAELIRERRDGPATVPAPVEVQDPTRTLAPEATDDAPTAAQKSAVGAGSSRTPADSAYVRRVAEWGIQAAEGLEHAHGLGIVHRDVKPGNLLVDERGELYVADFGLAKLAADPGMTGTGDVLGTLRYMSPEQADAKHDLVDHRSDVYSLGVTLYELLTLTPAFDGTDRQDILSKVTGSDPVSPRKLERHIPRDLETVVLKALEKDPDRRYQSAKELADDLRRFLNHEPVRAKPATLAQRARKWGRRHPAVVRSALLVLVLVAAGSSLSSWLVWREKGRTADALAAETAARTRADEEKRIAQAVRDFLRKLLAQADPRVQADSLRRGGGGVSSVKPDLMVREFLDRTARELTSDRIDGQFPGQPLVQAEILRTIGEAYTAIGEYDAAISHLERARRLHDRELGADHPDTLATIHSLARAYLGAGKPLDAAQLLEPVCGLRRETLGLDHPDTLAGMNDLARCYYRLKEHAKALELREEIVRRRRALLGPDHRDTLESMNNLANSYAAPPIGRVLEALTLHQETLALRTRTLGEDDPDTLQSMTNVGNCHVALDEYAEALRVHQKALKGRRSRLGPDDPDTLQSMNNVAVAYSALGWHKDARDLHEETLALRTKKLHHDHPDTLQSTNALAWILANCPDRTLRDPKRALELAKQAVKLASKNGGYQNTLGTAYYRVGDWKNAIEALTKSTELRKGGDGTDWFFLAMAHWHLGDKDQSRTWYDRAVRVMKETERPDEDLRQFLAEADELLGIGKQ